jgi:predicted adenylyl cyclase CyaB
MTEIEVKIRVQDLKAVREKILGSGAVISRDRHLETNTLFDFAAGDLRASRRALRLRATGKRKSRSFKVREEFETQVRDAKELRRILKALGLRETFAYAKRRTIFRKSRLTICLDETSVGDFLELEGERHEITRFARSLGYSRTDFITDSYVEMIVQAGGKDALS